MAQAPQDHSRFGGAPPPGGASDYTRFVRTARVLLPALGLALVAVVVVGSLLHRTDDGHFALSLAGSVDIGSGRQQMSKPQYFGTTQQNEPYAISAERAEETTRGSNIIQLDKPKADIHRHDNSWISAQAGYGLWSENAGGLDLSQAVDVYQDGGFEFHTATATLNTKKGTAVGHEPVNGHGPLGIISGQGFRMEQDSGRILVTGPAHMVIDQQTLPPPPASPKPAL